MHHSQQSRARRGCGSYPETDRCRWTDWPPARGPAEQALHGATADHGEQGHGAGLLVLGVCSPKIDPLTGSGRGGGGWFRPNLRASSVPWLQNEKRRPPNSGSSMSSHKQIPLALPPNLSPVPTHSHLQVQPLHLSLHASLLRASLPPPPPSRGLPLSGSIFKDTASSRT